MKRTDELDIWFYILITLMAIALIIGYIEYQTSKEIKGGIVPCKDNQGNEILGLECKEIKTCGIVGKITGLWGCGK